VQLSDASITALILVLAAAGVIALRAIALGPAPHGPVSISTQAAPGPKPRVHERAPSSARRTPRRGSGQWTAGAGAPSHSPMAAAVLAPALPTPELVVERYYRALGAGRFEDAWTLLTPAVRSALGPFEAWRDGYATTLSSTPRDIEVARAGAVATIAHELVTEDRSSCGPIERRFAVRWRLVATGEGWRAASLTAQKRSGAEPEDACPARHDAARATGGVAAD
jgi:hypothetical protein